MLLPIKSEGIREILDPRILLMSEKKIPTRDTENREYDKKYKTKIATKY